MKQFLAALTLALAFSFAAAYAQQAASQPQTNPNTTPAYSMLILRKVEVGAELEKFLKDYDTEHPRAKRLQFELDALRREMKKMMEFVEPQVSKLTSGYGSLILRRVTLESDIQSLLLEYTSDWPEVKDKQTELQLLDKEIAKVLK